LQAEHEFTVIPAFGVEKAILGCLLSAPGYDVLQDLAQIKEQYFYSVENKQAFRAILAIVERGGMPDMMLTYQQDKDLSPVYLSDLCKDACFPAQLDHYIAELRENYRRRTLEYALLQAHSEIGGGGSREEIEDRLVTSLSKDRLEEATTGIADGYDLQALLSGQHVQQGVISGMEELDIAMAGGIMRSEVCIAAARTSVGKSALAVLWMIAAVLKGWAVLYMSYEMPRSQVWRRALSYWSRVSLRKFRQGYFDDFDRVRVNRANKELSDYWPHIRVNCTANKPGELQRLIRLEQLRYGDNLFVIIDHAGRMKSDGKNSSSYERMSDIANRQKDIAIDCNIPLLTLWQLSRAVERDGREGKKPQLSDLRNTGEAEEIADEILLLSRDSYYDSSIPIDQATVTIDVAKARDGGKLGAVQVPWLRLISRPELREAGDD
jgi:replicative DNA helicase